MADDIPARELAAHRLLRQETMLCCIPLRLGVFSLSVCTLATSLLYCMDRYDWHSVFRHFEGGFCPSSWAIVGAMQICGVAGGVAGICGAWHVRVSYLKTYLYWQYLRLAGVLLTYYFDLPLLRDCEGYVFTTERMVETYGWNDVVYQTALTGQCPSERKHFLLCAFPFVVALMYATSRTARYIELVDRAPSVRELLAKAAPSGAYFARPTGERCQPSLPFRQHYPFDPVQGTWASGSTPFNRQGDRAGFGSIQILV
jgi:hypothetical protein